MGRLSTFAKNRILNLRFQKCYRIKQIAQTLIQEDNIKVSRKSISTFLKKYIETKSINDKPRSGRNKKLTPEEINLIGEVTRLNRDITAPKIKEYLNLNVSTYTILRASKLFEWNKLNPNSNQAKREAALQRQKATTDEPSSESEIKLPTCSSTTAANVSSSRSSSSRRRKAATAATAALLNTSGDEDGAANGMSSCGEDSINLNTSINESKDIKYEPLPPEANLNVIPEEEILLAKNVSSSPMVFTTKMLYKLFRLDELIGHNVSGKTFNKFIKNKKALDERRVNYIRYLVERHYSDEETPDLSREELWKACRTAINKSIRNNEIKMAAAAGVASTTNPAELALLTNLTTPGATTTSTENTVVKLNNDLVFMEDGQILMRQQQQQQQPRNSVNKSRDDETAETTGLLNLEPNMTIVQITNDLPPNEAEQETAAVGSGNGPATSVAASTVNSQYFENNSELISSHGQSTVIQLTSVSSVDFSSSPIKTYADLSSSQIKMDYQDSYPSASGVNSMDYMTSGNHQQLGSEGTSSSESASNQPFEVLAESEILDMRARFTSPMIFATKVLTRIFTKDQLVGHNLSTKSLVKSGSKPASKQQQQQPTLDEDRINYIKSLVEKYYINSPASGSSSSSSAVPSTRSGGSKKNLDDVWISCRKAINRVIRNFEIKESKLIKSIETEMVDDEEQDDDETEEEETPQQPEQKNNVVNTRPNTRASRYRAARS